MRPEGWPELGEHPCSGDGCLECRDYANREAGADAMLEGLREEVDSITVKSHKGKKRTPGVWVFIPEEKE